MSWYYIGPDKTGLACDYCCAGFYESFGSCLPASCEVSGSKVYRDYLCPNSNFPTPFHYYKLDPVTNTATISVNPTKCTTLSPECATYTPSEGLNAAGRVGSGCSQTVVISSTSCFNSTQSCTFLGCETACGYEQQPGAIVWPYSCMPNGGNCSCSQIGPSYSTCGCICANPRSEWNNTCCNPNEGELCYCGGGGQGCVPCPDGTEACFGLPCPCEGSALPDPPCNFCEQITCPGPGGTYYCAEKQCYPACSAGYECSCGSCSCNAPSTCCVGDLFGYIWDASAKACRSCGYGYPPPTNCCAPNRAGCSSNDSICCNDGRCYNESTTLCRYS